MSRARVAALTAVLLVAGGAAPSTAGAAQPPERAADSPVPAVDVRTDRPAPPPLLVEREPRRRGSMPDVLPRGPRAVPMPELLRSGPRPVPIPGPGSEFPFDHPRRGELNDPRDLRGSDGPRGTDGGGSQVIPEELEDTVETLVP